MIDLTRLPAPAVVERLDYEEILAQMLADYSARWPEFSAWVESEPALKLLQVVAYREMLLRARVNDASRAVMLPWSTGADLDNLAALYGVARAAGESDADLRRRVVLSLGAHNTAGAGIVCVDSPAAGTARVVVGGAVSGEGAAALDAQPSLALYGAAAAVFARDDVRPVTDAVQVRAMRVRPYRVTAEIAVEAGADAAAVRAASEAAVRAHCLGRHRCGADVHRSAVINALFAPGVESATLTAPAADVEPAADEAPWPTAGSAVVYGDAEPAAEPTRHPMDGIAVTVA